MDFKKLQTNIKDNKRQIVEQEAYIDEKFDVTNEKIDLINSKIDEVDKKFVSECNSIKTSISSNVSTLKNYINTVSMVPTSEYTNVALTTSSADYTQFTAPYNGYFFVSLQNGSSTNTFYLNNSTAAGIASGTTTAAWDTVLLFVPCKKGDVIYYSRGSAPSNIWWARFIKGAQV